MRRILIYALASTLFVATATAANNIVINQANGNFAVLSATESGGVYTLNVACN